VDRSTRERKKNGRKKEKREKKEGKKQIKNWSPEQIGLSVLN
jgi:hypothetical protein